MSNKRLIDGEKLLEWLEERQMRMNDWTRSFERTAEKIKEGEFDIPNQGEAARYRDALETIHALEKFGMRETMWNIAHEALSLHTEDTDRGDTE